MMARLSEAIARRTDLWKWVVGALFSIVLALSAAWANGITKQTDQIPVHAERIKAVETEVSGVSSRLDHIEAKLDRVLERR